MKPASFRWKTIIGAYFIFSKWQRRAAVFLVACLLVLVFAPAIFLYFFGSRLIKTNRVLIEQSTQLKVKTENSHSDYKDHTTDHQALREPTPAKAIGELFLFDPNTATVADWERLGIRPKTITTIQNYLAKGGYFRKAEDLQKIYGLHADEAARLIPYVRIAGKGEKKMYADRDAKTAPAPALHSNYKSVTSHQAIDINMADTTAFIALPGIGSKLAARIVNYREKLHGFYSIEQVGETYGLPDSTFQKIKPQLRVSDSFIQKMNINTATMEELKTPYIRFNVANAIVQYRLHNGPFVTVEDLRKIPLIDEPLFIKIAPYLKAE